MIDHYYSKNPGAASHKQVVTSVLKGKTFRFLTDAGVFSKRGVDFGTRLLIETAELPEKGTILDLGCGYGPVGIACAQAAPGCQVTMVDPNRRALELARQNAKENGVDQRVEVLESDGFQELQERRFDCVLTNPPIRAGKEIVYRLFREARDHLKPGGALWVVIRKQQGGPSAKKELESLFRRLETAQKKKGYWILHGLRVEE